MTERPSGGVMRFRKGPVVIEAVQWTGDNLRDVIALTELYETAEERWLLWRDYEDYVARHGLKIFTLEGPLMASVGDWIIKGVKGECYPCKPDVFAATYTREEGDANAGLASVGPDDADAPVSRGEPWGFVCAHCGAFASTADGDTLESGATLRCDGCGKDTVVLLLTPSQYCADVDLLRRAAEEGE